MQYNLRLLLTETVNQLKEGQNKTLQNYWHETFR
jgi:hypothetical protein